jgi:hypothetical protein
MYGLWHELAMPTLYVPFGDTTLAKVNHGLAGYVGEIERNGFDRLYPARAVAAAVQGSERIFGFGAASASTEPYAELFTEVVRVGGHWRLGAARVFDAQSPLADATDTDVDWWMTASSTRQRRAEEPAKQ